MTIPNSPAQVCLRRFSLKIDGKRRQLSVQYKLNLTKEELPLHIFTIKQSIYARIRVLSLLFFQNVFRHGKVCPYSKQSTVQKKVMFQTKVCTKVGNSLFLAFIHDQKMDIIFCQDGQFMKCRNEICFLLVRF